MAQAFLPLELGRPLRPAASWFERLHLLAGARASLAVPSWSACHGLTIDDAAIWVNGFVND